MTKTIQELRESRHWTQLELANQLGVRPESISNWERGRAQPRYRYLRQIAELFEMSPDDIKLVAPEA